MNERASDLLRQIEIINEKELLCKREKQFIYDKLNQLKQSLIDKNKHLIGRRANAKSIDHSSPVACICTGIRVADDYETIMPIFDKINGERLSYDEYKFI